MVKLHVSNVYGKGYGLNAYILYIPQYRRRFSIIICFCMKYMFSSDFLWGVRGKLSVHEQNPLLPRWSPFGDFGPHGDQNEFFPFHLGAVKKENICAELPR